MTFLRFCRPVPGALRTAMVAAVLMLSGASAAAQESAGGYRLAPEDVLQISVWKEEALQREVLVRPDGKLTFPLVGALDAAGKTAEQLQGEIEELLQPYIPDPVVTVSILQVAGNKIYIIGQVNKPGMYPIGRPTDVMQALSLAGGLTPFAAADKIRILRRVQDRQTVLPFNYVSVAQGESLDQNVILRSGDVVVVR